jgi:hypothetical protein
MKPLFCLKVLIEVFKGHCCTAYILRCINLTNMLKHRYKSYNETGELNRTFILMGNVAIVDQL